MNKNCLTDNGPNPNVINIKSETLSNNTYRTSIWTGKYLQVTVMAIPCGGDIGIEMHPDTDQFLRVEQGIGIVKMGISKSDLAFCQQVRPGSAIMIPAGEWHNVINAGNIPLKMYSIYAPPHHPFCTVHQTKESAMHEEH